MGRKLQLLPARASMPHKKNSSISLKLTTMVTTPTTSATVKNKEATKRNTALRFIRVKQKES
jgi:hypothetical protein